MIVADTSALVAYLAREAGWENIEACLSASPATSISSGTLVELLIVTQSRDIDAAARRLLDDFGIEVVDVTVELAFAAGEAHRRYGRKNHAASLNFGDCFAYALAKSRDLPLLFVGGDFAKTDVRSALG